MKSELEINELFLRADALIKDKNHSDALNLLDSILLEDPTFGKAHNHIGWLYEVSVQDKAKAENHYKQAIIYDPSYCPAYINYAIFLSSQHRYAELKEHLDDAINVVGINKSLIYQEYAIMFEMQELYKKSIDAFKNAIKYSIDAQHNEIYLKGIARCKTKAGFFKSLFW